MKLLLDQNLPDQLLEVLAPAFPDSTHVRLIGLAAASDDVVWRHARDHEFAIVSKDTDFYELSLISGTPPKVVRLSCGNVTNRFLRALVERHIPEIRTFLDDPEAGCLELG